MSSEGFGNQVSCRVLEVSESGFYAWRNRPPSVRAMRHLWLTEIIRDIHTTSRGTYGARRVHADLTLGRGLTVARCTVELLMQRAELAGLPGRRRHRAIHETSTASDLVDRNFAREEPNRLWVTDITEHSTREGKLYCAVVLDTFSRRVVGWSIDSNQTAGLVTSALSMALTNRTPPAGTVIHSDHGTQFTSWVFTRRAQESGLVASMGSIGDCYDNAVIESFFSLLQKNVLNRRRWTSRGQLRLAIVTWIERTYHRRRRQDALGRLTPIEFETLHHAAHAA